MTHAIYRFFGDVGSVPVALSLGEGTRTIAAMHFFLRPSRSSLRGMLVFAVGLGGCDVERQVGESSNATHEQVPGSAMVTIPAGTFMLGCDRATAPLETCDGHSPQPQVVSLPSFAIDQREVSVGEYSACIAAGACQAIPPVSPGEEFMGGPLKPFAEAELPMILVTADDASAFCKWLGKRLPTDLEWEAAARGTDGRLYPWGNAWLGCPAVVICDKGEDCDFHPESWGCDSGTAAAVGSHPQDVSPYGVLDLGGNVSEWVTVSGEQKFGQRGSSWSSKGHYGSASGHGYPAPVRLLDLGFRCTR